MTTGTKQGVKQNSNDLELEDKRVVKQKDGSVNKNFNRQNNYEQ